MQRNAFGRLPLQQPHNNILNDNRIKEVFKNFLYLNSDYINKIWLQKEPDYMFVVNSSRE